MYVNSARTCFKINILGYENSCQALKREMVQRKRMSEGYDIAYYSKGKENPLGM